MRIAMIHASFGVRGGAEQYIRDLSAALQAQGHEVAVFAVQSDGERPGDHRVPPRFAARLTTRSTRLGKVLTHLADLVDPTGLSLRDLRVFRPDVVHVHNWQGLGAVAVDRVSREFPTCHSVHDHAVCDPNNAMANIGRSRILDALLAVRSAWIVRRFRRTLMIYSAARTKEMIGRCAPGAQRLAAEVVPMAVAVPGWHGAWPPGRRNTFLYLGALTRHKGVDLLIEAWRGVADRIDGTLLIGGSGPLREDIERLSAATGSVRYLGYLDIEGKRAAFSESGWLVFPSQCTETFGLVCAEALIAGRPLIVSARAEPPMASPTSMLVFNDVAELRALLIRAATLPDGDYEQLAAMAADDGTRIDWDVHVGRIVGAYERVAAHRAHDSVHASGAPGG